MDAFLQPHHGADHDGPYQQEARHFLGPDVVRQEICEARKNLQSYGKDQDENTKCQQYRQKAAVEISHSLHGMTQTYLAHDAPHYLSGD